VAETSPPFFSYQTAVDNADAIGYRAASILSFCQQRRFDRGIVVDFCDRIHEACACDVSSTNGESSSKT